MGREANSALPVSPRGRRSRVFDRGLVALIVEAIGAGLPAEEASILAGLPRSTFYSWLQRGRIADERREAGRPVYLPDTPFLDFLDQIREAEARAVVERVVVIRRAAARGSWRAAAWWLERMHPDRFGPPRARRRSQSATPAALRSPEAATPAALERKVALILAPGKA